MKSLSDILRIITSKNPKGNNRPHPRPSFDATTRILFATYRTYSNPSFMRNRQPYLPSKFLKQSANI